MAESADPAGRLELLAREAAGCTRCRLAETRSNVVFGEGNPAAPLVFVGEGPGQVEDATGRPFVGRAGALLDECMAAAGLTRKHVYICNVVKCRACIAEEGRTRNRAPQQDEIDACAPWLHRQLETISPLVIVCLGAPAANSLIHRNFRMTQERGQWFTTSPFCRYICAALHPAYILRQVGDVYQTLRLQLIEDIDAARRKVIEARKEPPRTLFDL